jgi:hypothetical protein
VWGAVRYLTPTASLSPPCRATCAVVFSGGVVFLRCAIIARTSRTCCADSQCMPPSLWGVFVFRGVGGFRVRTRPVGGCPRQSGVLWGPTPVRAAYFCLAPKGRFSSPPILGGVYVLWIFCFCGVCYLCGMEKRNRGGCPIVSAKNALKGQVAGFACAAARAPLRVQLGVFAGFLLHAGEAWLMLWPLIWHTMPA